jgi:hypothetical protein
VLGCKVGVPHGHGQRGVAEKLLQLLVLRRVLIAPASSTTTRTTLTSSIEPEDRFKRVRLTTPIASYILDQLRWPER